MKLVKPKTKDHLTFTSGIYAYSEVLQIIAEISNKIFQNKIFEKVKIEWIKVCIADKSLSDI